MLIEEDGIAMNERNALELAGGVRPARKIRIMDEYVRDLSPEGAPLGQPYRMFYCTAPMVVRLHRERAGPQGLAVGGTGPGSLDVALNVLEYLVPVGSDGLEMVRCRVNYASRTAYGLHRSFCSEFISRMDPRGGELSVRDCERWISLALKAP